MLSSDVDFAKRWPSGYFDYAKLSVLGSADGEVLRNVRRAFLDRLEMVVFGRHALLEEFSMGRSDVLKGVVDSLASWATLVGAGTVMLSSNEVRVAIDAEAEPTEVIAKFNELISVCEAIYDAM